MMHFERVTDTCHTMYKTALRLYGSSFPFHEQREPASQAKILHDISYHFHLVYDAQTFIGIILFWETEAFIYVEHFCILPEMRNKRYGTRVLELLKNENKPIILEIDPPIDERSIHRKNFYERSGFVDNPYPHIHPPYHMGDRGHDLVILSFPSVLAASEYDCFKQYLSHRVMANPYA